MTVTVSAASEAHAADRKLGNFVGDLLLIFGSETSALRGRNRTSSASLLAQKNEWSLYSFPTTLYWKGYPMLEFSFGDWQVWFLGEVYGATNSDEAHLMIKESIEGLRDFSKLNGHYLVFAWNSEKSQWNIWTNRLGTLHAYQTSNAIGTCFNSIVRAAVNTDLDDEGLLGFFAFGFFPQNRTYCKAIKILRPAIHEVYDVSGTKIREERYWNWKFNPDSGRNYESTVEAFGTLLHEVMVDLCRTGRISIPISGGLDSRSTVAALYDRSNDPLNQLRAYSYGYTPDSVEIRIARRVAVARNIPFDSFQIPQYLFELLPHIFDAVEGFQDLTQSRQAAVNEHLREYADYVIAAHWGDVWLDDPGSLEIQDEDEMISAAMKKFRKRGSNWFLDNFTGGFSKGSAAEGLLSEMIREELSRLKGIEDPEFRMKALKTEQWSFRWTTASLRAYQLAAFPRLPFYDTRMIDFFATVPSDFVRGRRLQIDFIKRFAPDLARIPWQVYDANLYNYQHYQTWLLPKRAFKKMQRMLSRRPQIQRNWEAQLLHEEGRSALKQFLCGGQGSKIEEFFPATKIETLLDDLFVTPSPENGYTASMLLTFAAWLGNHV